MLLSSNGRTPVSQTDVDAGSIPVKSANWPVRLEEGLLVFNQKRGDRYPYGLQKYWKVAEWLNAFDCKSNLFGVRGFESLPSNKKLKNILGG